MTPPPTDLRRRLQSVLAIALGAWMALLAVLYVYPGDTTPWGEYLTVWPPILWAAPAIALALALLWRCPRVPAAVLLVGVVGFTLGHVEWRSLLRWGRPTRTAGEVRVVTWNIGGGYGSPAEILAALAPLEPDLVFLQESPDSADAFGPEALTGYFEGWIYIDGGDGATLSRWPAERLATERIGPWDQPQLLAVTMPDGRQLLTANVRLMLPSLVLLPISRGGRETLAQDNRERLAQFPALAALIEARRSEGDYAGIVLAGDFNTVMSARSLAPLRARLTDCWSATGRGWGATVTRDFPAARIDGILVGGGLEPRHTHVAHNALSDHRPVVADLRLP